MKPLYMWAGGKNKMIPKYLTGPGIPLTGYSTYVEPFFGGGAMMIYVYENNPEVKRFVLNDINSELVGLYHAIKSDVDGFLQRTDALTQQYLPLSKADRKTFYYALRQEYTQDYAKWTAVEESATLYFLMKTAFNGIWQSTIEARGRFCTPSGLLNHKTYVVDRENVLEWHKFLQQVDIMSGDWRDCVKTDAEPAFYFFDPPYRSSFTQYDQTFTDNDHSELIDFCRTSDANGHLVMYCNRESDDDFYTRQQGNLELTHYPITYTVGRRATDADGNKSAKAAVEILLSSPAIRQQQPVAQFDALFETL